MYKRGSGDVEQALSAQNTTAPVNIVLDISLIIASSP
jgi:hypothetical protein